MSISGQISLLLLAGLALLGALTAVGRHVVTCPHCGGKMKRTRRDVPKAPYYLDFAHRCARCGHEVDGGSRLE